MTSGGWMRRRLPVILAAVALVGLATVLFALMAGSHPAATTGAQVAKARAPIDDPHRDPGIPPARRARILNAVDAVSQDVPHAELAAEGRALFRSSNVARDGESCQSCHTEGATNAGADPAGGTLGLGTIPHDSSSSAAVVGAPQLDFIGLRNAPALFNVGQTDPFGWTGQVPTLDGFALNAVTNHFSDPQPTGAQLTHDIAALVAYMETIKAPSSDFDRGTLSPAAIRGQLVFQNQGGCIGCHNGPNFTDGLLHNVGVPQPPGATDSGVEPRADGQQCGTPFSNANPLAASPQACFFNTPSLRGVARTAPYFHNGIEKTLRDVVVFYNGDDPCTGTIPPVVSTIAPLGFACGDVNDLVAYLKSI